MSFFVSSYNNSGRRFARNNSQLFSETSGMMPNSAGVEKFFARMTFKGVRHDWTARRQIERVVLCPSP
jgi:hypothetical protein